MKKSFIFILIGLIFVGCSKEEISYKSHSKTIKNVKVDTIKALKIREEVKLTGSVIPLDKARIFSKVIGEVRDIKVTEGEYVKKGDIIIDIDDSLYRARLKQAKATSLEIKRHIDSAKKKLSAAKSNFILAKKTYNRFKKLKDKGVVSKQKYDEVLANFNSAKSMYMAARSEVDALYAKLKMVKAKVEEAKIYIGYTKIRAPFKGIVIKKFVDIGDSVAPSSPLLEIQYNNNYQIKCEVPEAYINFIKIGDRIKSEILKKMVPATVTTIVPLGNEISRSYEVKLNIPSFDFIKPGMFASVFIKTREITPILVPTSSVVSHGQIQGLYIVDKNGKINFRVIRTGRIMNNMVEIISGVRPGERYVVSPTPSINHGDKIAAGGVIYG